MSRAQLNTSSTEIAAPQIKVKTLKSRKLLPLQLEKGYKNQNLNSAVKKLFKKHSESSTSEKKKKWRLRT